MRATRLLLATALLTGSWIGDLISAELKVLSVIPMRPSLQELAPAFEASSGHKLKVEYATTGAVEQRIVNDEEADVVILTKSLADKLGDLHPTTSEMQSVKIVGGTVKPLARVEIGVAVRKGAAKPDISSVEALKQTLLKAKGIVYDDPAAGAMVSAQIAEALEKLGIADEVKQKTHVNKRPAGRDFADRRYGVPRRCRYQARANQCPERDAGNRGGRHVAG